MRFPLLFVIGVIGFPVKVALGCSIEGDPPTDEQLFERASAVFTAHITRTEEVTTRFEGFPEQVQVVEGSLTVLETFKGKAPADNKVRDFVFGPGNCSLGLLAGLDYIFFIQDQKHNLVLWPTGSRPFTNIEGTEPMKLLDKLRGLSKPKARK